jgi:hypothetical protein
MTTDVGLAIQAAIERGETHRPMWQGRLLVRLFNYQQGLATVVTVPGRDYAEVGAIKRGTRVIPRSELSRRAHELPMAEALVILRLAWHSIARAKSILFGDANGFPQSIFNRAAGDGLSPNITIVLFEVE